MNKEEIKKELIKFANYLNKYATLEYVRFDFMVIDYLQTIEEPEDQMFDHNSSLKICERCGDNEISKNNDVFCDKCIQQIDDEFDDLISI